MFASLGCEKARDAAPGEVYDAGPVLAGTSSLRHQFRVVNTTDRTVRVVDESHSCTCTVVELRKASLRPGEGTTLTMTVDMPNVYEKGGVFCTVKTDHPKYPKWDYAIRYERFPTIRFDPDRVDLGEYELASGPGPGPAEKAAGSGLASKKLFLEIYTLGAGSARLEPGPIRATEGLEARMSPRAQVDRLGGGVLRERYEVEVGLAAMPRTPGMFSGTIEVSAADTATVQAVVAWSCDGPLRCSPSRIHFGLVDPGDERSQKVLVRSVDGRPFRVLAAESDGPVASLSLPDGPMPSSPGTSHGLTLGLRVPKDHVGRFLSGTAVVRTDEPGASELRIPWSAFLRDAGSPPGEGGPSPPGERGVR